MQIVTSGVTMPGLCLRPVSLGVLGCGQAGEREEARGQGLGQGKGKEPGEEGRRIPETVQRPELGGVAGGEMEP